MDLQVEPPEKKKKKKKTKNSSPPSSPPPSSSPSFSLLPDEITANCLARISRSYYPTLSIVSKSFRSILSSTELYSARSHLGSTEEFLYVCLWNRSYESTQWFTLWTNPKCTLPDSMIKKRKKEKTIGPRLVPKFMASPWSFSCLSKATIVVGSEIYVIGGPVFYEPSSAIQIFDCRSHTWRDGPRMNVARKNAYACVYDGKIYVVGGCVKVEDSWAEVFDVKTQTWKLLPHPDPGTELHNSYIYIIAEIQGKIHIQTSLKTYAYDTKEGKWECCKGTEFPRLECVMESVLYRHGVSCGGRYELRWLNDRYWEVVKGLDSLGRIYKRNGGSSCTTTKLVSCGGKLLLFWEEYVRNPCHEKKIWCAEIVIEKRDGGELWGKAEWVDVVYNATPFCQLLHCLVVSV